MTQTTRMGMRLPLGSSATASTGPCSTPRTGSPACSAFTTFRALWSWQTTKPASLLPNGHVFMIIRPPLSSPEYLCVVEPNESDFVKALANVQHCNDCE